MGFSTGKHIGNIPKFSGSACDYLIPFMKFSGVVPLPGGWAPRIRFSG